MSRGLKFKVTKKGKITVPEKAIENQILSYLKANRVFCFKNETGGVFDVKRKRFRKAGPYVWIGASDILGIFKGRFLAIEVKSRTGKTTEAQDEFLKRVREEGGIGFVARSIDDVQRELGILSLDLLAKI